MPRGPGKKENYNFDYSRFNGVDPEEVISAGGDDPEMPGGMPAEILRQLPGELQEAFRLMQIAKQTGDTKAQERANELAVKAVERGGPEMKQRFQQEVMRQAAENPEARKGIEAIINRSAPTGVTPTPSPSEQASAAEKQVSDLSDTITQLQGKMKAGAESAHKQLEAMKEQQEKLEQLSGPEDFARFMAEQGLGQDDLQRALSGDEAHMKKMIEKALGRFDEPNESQDRQKMDAVLSTVDDIHRQLNGDTPDRDPPPPSAPAALPAPPPEKPKERKKKEEEPAIPVHRVQYQKDEAGKLQQVELRCDLPGIDGMASIEVDVSEKYLRLRTISPAYVVNVGPFPALVDAPAARAKFSKKRQELTLTVPALP